MFRAARSVREEILRDNPSIPATGVPNPGALPYCTKKPPGGGLAFILQMRFRRDLRFPAVHETAWLRRESTKRCPKMSTSTLTRRDFVMKVGQIGGCAFTALSALGFVTKARGAGPELSGLPPVTPGRKVVIMGAGIAGLTAAYELGKLGIDSIVLEPRGVPGGRCLTVRGGDVIEETTGAKQTCAFEDGLYFNPGPSRFPQWHVTMDYCRELGVAVEPFVSANENAFYYSEAGKGPLSGRRVRIREAKTDLRGHAAELLAKVADQKGLDESLSSTDMERMVEFLRLEGGLSPDLAYRGHNRRGYKVNPGGGEQQAELDSPYELSALLEAGFGRWFHRANDYIYQSQMFAPTGGMDRLAFALYEKVKDKVLLGARVTEFRRTNPGVRVVYERNGTTSEVTGDFGICTIPPPVMRRIPNDFSMMVKNTLNIVPFQNSGKIALQFKRRFWEEDDRVFGGISWTDLPIAEIWYDSHGFLGRKGLINGYYLFGPVCDQVARMSPAERTEFALTHGEKIHPQYRKEFENALSVNWATLPHLEGCLAHFPQAMIKTFYPFLIKPEGELYIAASWASHLGGWQAGAFEAARLAVHGIYERVRAA
jgi:monoamine oxidase